MFFNLALTFYLQAQIEIINLRIRVLRTLMPRKARHTVPCDPERASGAIKRLLAFLNRISMNSYE